MTIPDSDAHLPSQASGIQLTGQHQPSQGTRFQVCPGNATAICQPAVLKSSGLASACRFAAAVINGVSAARHATGLAKPRPAAV